MGSTLPYDLESLQKAVRRGARPDFLFFWGHTAKGPQSALGKECFSQWYGAPFTLEGRTFATAEHFMMFRKAVLFRDQETAEEILAAESPAAAKKLGRKVRGFVQSVWNKECLEIVARGNEAKFGQNQELGAFLLRTGDSILVEASPTDQIWGIGLAESDSRATNPLKWRGQNLLGFALMIARDRLAHSRLPP